MTISALGSFILVVGLLTLTPGLDTALIIRTAGIAGTVVVGFGIRLATSSQ